MSTFKTTYDDPALSGEAIAPDRARALLGQVNRLLFGLVSCSTPSSCWIARSVSS